MSNAAASSGSDRARPGKVSISFDLAHGRGGVLSVRQLRRDALASDDAAWAVVDPPKHLLVLAVTDAARSTAPLRARARPWSWRSRRSSDQVSSPSWTTL